MENILKSIEIYGNNCILAKNIPTHINLNLEKSKEAIENSIRKQLKIINNQISAYTIFEEYEVDIRDYCDLTVAMLYIRLDDNINNPNKCMHLGLEFALPEASERVFLLSEINGKHERVKVSDLYLLNKMDIGNTFAFTINLFDNVKMQMSLTENSISCLSISYII